MTFYILLLASALFAVGCTCTILAGNINSKRYWATCAVAMAASSFIGVILYGDRQLTNLGAANRPPSVVYIAGGIALCLAAVCALIALILPSTTGSRTPRYLSFGISGVVLSRAAATFLESGEFDVYFLLWLLVVLGVLSAVAEDSSFISIVRWVPRFITTASLVAAVLAPTWAFMTASESGRSILGLGRLVGLTSHPNSLAQFAVIALAFELFGPKGTRNHLLWLGPAIICGVLSQSTTALLAGGLLLVVWLLSDQGRVRIFGACAAIAGLGWLIATEGGLVDALLDTDRFQTVSGRQIIWQYSWTSIMDHPFLGLGTTFLSDEFRMANLPADQQQAIHAHNQLVQTLGESGFIGGACLVIVFAGLFLHALRTVPTAGFGLVATWLAVVVLSYTEVLIRPAGPTGVIGILILAFLSHVPTSSTRIRPIDFTPLARRAPSKLLLQPGSAPRSDPGFRG